MESEAGHKGNGEKTTFNGIRTAHFLVADKKNLWMVMQKLFVNCCNKIWMAQ